MNRLRFDVLGPLRARCGSAEIDLGPRRRQVILGVLLLAPNRQTSRDRLIDAVWDDAPTYAVNLLQKHIAALRRVLAKESLLWTGAGYRLSVDESSVDLIAFDRAVAGARRDRATGDLRSAADGLRSALNLWRGSFCEGLSSPLLDRERDLQEERRLDLIEERVELDLATGDPRELICELRALTAEHPLRERLWGLLMLALYRCGRVSDALTTFHRARDRITAELGLEPTAELRELHQQMIAGDPSPPERASQTLRERAGQTTRVGEGQRRTR